MKIRWLRTALNNLNDEANYIAEENPQMAKIVIQRIKVAVHLLSEQPAMGRPGRVYGTRELIIPDTRYIIPYRVKNNVLEILRVFHTARKTPKNW
jgi:toxin ParE1/3/4